MKNQHSEEPSVMETTVFLHQVNALIASTLHEYATGPILPIVQEHLAHPGKQLRARMTQQAAVALEVDPKSAVPLAAACELLHNASLLHDDWQDADHTRRGRPALWVTYGAEQAITAGDLLLMLATTVLKHSEADPSIRWELARAVSERAAQTASGQSADLALRPGRDLTWADFESAATAKTGPLFALPIEGAALLAGWPADRAKTLGDATLVLGLLFQILDDVLDLYGDKLRGERGSDLREGKVSALVAAHLSNHHADADALLATLALSRQDTGDDAINQWTARFHGSGTVQYLQRVASELVRTMEHHELLKGAPELAAPLLQLARMLETRIQDVPRPQPRQSATSITGERVNS